MPHDWKNPEHAGRWDTAGDRTNPTRQEQLDILLTVLAELIGPSGLILDLGYGSGKVEAMIFERLPQTRVVGIDSSPAMADLAGERLRGYAGRFVPVLGDLAQLSDIALAQGPFDAVIAIQSLHHLSPEAMQAVYADVFRRLRPGGVFLLLDRLKLAGEGVFPLLRSVWERLDRDQDSETAPHEGETFAVHLLHLQEQGDRPALLEDHLAWLSRAGFDAAVLHVHGNRGLLGAIRR
jgi:SAM-dependent methyltransferase